MVANSTFLGSLAVLALAAVAPSHAQSFQGDGTAYTLGQVSQGNCNFMASSADAATNYAAINQAQWDGLKNCGRCAQVSCVDDACADKSVSEIVHIVDRCPECKQGDLDLSPSVFKKITGSSPSRLKISWKFVDCPNPGKLQYCLKSGSNPYFVAIQPANAGSGIASMKINDKATTMVDSAFYYVLDSTTPVDLSAVKVSLTSTSGAAVEETVSLSVGSCTAGKSQFGSGTPPATTPKATPKPATTPKATPKPATTPKATPAPSTTPKTTPKPATTPSVGSESTVAPAPASPTPITGDDESSGSSSEPTTEAPGSDDNEAVTPAPAYDDETPAPASDDEYGSSSASAGTEPTTTPAPASDDEYSGSSPSPAAASSSGAEPSSPAPSSDDDDAEDGSGAVVTPTETPVVTPAKTAKPSKCSVDSAKTKKTKAEKKAEKEKKKAEKAAKKAKKDQDKLAKKSSKKATESTTAQDKSANSTSSYSEY